MKKFHFTLARVLQFRRMQADAEQAKLIALEQKAQALQREIQDLDTRFQMEVAAVGDSSPERNALGHFRIHYRDQRMRKAYHFSEAERAAAAQREIYVRANQRAQVLDRIRKKQYSQWEADFRKELDQLAMDSFLAQWKPEDPNQPPH
jgi:DNA repair ATPase RecN